MNFCSDICINAYVNNSKSGDTRRSRPRNNNRALISSSTREEVALRDKCCRFCGVRSELQLHHIIYRSHGGSSSEDNLITLCPQHHDLVHSNKERFLSLCQGVLWFHSLGTRVSIPNLEKFLDRFN